MHKTITLSDAVEKIPDGASGGGLFAMSFYGAEKVIEHYNLMGPVRAALESAVRYLACELGPKVIRVHASNTGSRDFARTNENARGLWHRLF